MVCAAGESVLNPVCVQVDRVDLGACGTKESTGDLANEAAPDDADPLTDRDAGKPHSMQRDRGDRRQGCIFERHRWRHARTEIRRNCHKLSVIRKPRAGTGEPVARRETPHCGADAKDDSGGAVADGVLFGELPLYSLARLTDAFIARATKDVPNLIRTL
jgi:hypothetical protein